MKPIEPTVTAGAQTPVNEVLALCREKGVTRLPVWEMRDNQRRIGGLISLKSLLFRADVDPNKPIGDYMKPALFLNEDMRLEVALRRMQRSGQRLAIVLGREGREIGILSLQDVLRIIFGEVSL
jgi:CBS domain containing-hemolysin-like protein